MITLLIFCPLNTQTIILDYVFFLNSYMLFSAFTLKRKLSLPTCVGRRRVKFRKACCLSRGRLTDEEVKTVKKTQMLRCQHRDGGLQR